MLMTSRFHTGTTDVLYVLYLAFCRARVVFGMRTAGN